MAHLWIPKTCPRSGRAPKSQEGLISFWWGGFQSRGHVKFIQRGLSSTPRSWRTWAGAGEEAAAVVGAVAAGEGALLCCQAARRSLGTVQAQILGWAPSRPPGAPQPEAPPARAPVVTGTGTPHCCLRPAPAPALSLARGPLRLQVRWQLPLRAQPRGLRPGQSLR